MKPETNKIPPGFHLLYLLAAAGFVYLYCVIITPYIDFNGANSINAVSSFETYKPWQFRILIPLIFFIFKPLTFISQTTVFWLYSGVIVYLLILVYAKVLCEYFENRKIVLFSATFIIYPMIWNYVILNSIFQYYDFTAILIFTLGLYLIIKEKFLLLNLVFIAGVLNKETSGYLVVAYLLFNYKTIFTKKIIFRGLFMVALYAIIKIILGVIFRGNPGDPVELCMNENIKIIQSFFSNRLYFIHIVFSFGLIHIFFYILFLTGRWRKFPSRRLLFINLAFFPNILVGFFVTYFDEVRVYAEFIPLVTTLFLIYLSTFRRLNFRPVNKTE